MWFRAFLGAWTLLLTALFGWLASHGSSGAIVFHKYSPGYFLLLLAVAGLIALTLLAQSAFLYSRLYRIRREIILTLTAIFFSLMMAEAATRVFDPLGISYFEESTRYQLDMISDPALGYKHAPNLRRVYQGVEVSTNQFGLRDREIEPKQTGEFRILLLGDSVTFGWGVPIEATFGRRLENLLTTKLKRPVRAVNSGVGGYNTVQEYAVLKQLAGTVDPDMVVLLYVRNDIQSNDPSLNPETELTLDGKTPPEVILILAGKSWLYRLCWFALRYSRAPSSAILDENARGVKESLEALSGIAVLCRNRGLRFVTFYYRPLIDAASVPPLANQLFAAIENIGRRYGFPVIDVGKWWGELDSRSLTNSTVDRHHNARGHEILAARMANVLLERGIVNRSWP